MGDVAARYARRMQASLVTNGDVPQIAAGVPTYWVRIWTPPTDAQSAWFVDEWRISDAPDGLSVIDWAREQTHEDGSFEVFVESEDHALRSDSKYVPVTRHIRIYGAPADSGGVTEEVTFTGN